jgi:hypothetical protein
MNFQQKLILVYCGKQMHKGILITRTNNKLEVDFTIEKAHEKAFEFGPFQATSSLNNLHVVNTKAIIDVTLSVNNLVVLGSPSTITLSLPIVGSMHTCSAYLGGLPSSSLQQGRCFQSNVVTFP